MSKGLKIFFWILMAVVVILIIYIAVTAKKGSKTKPPPSPAPDGSGTVITGNTDADKAGIDTNTPPATVGSKTFFIGQEIYAGQDILNVYKSCDPSASTIGATYNKGTLIGTFLRKEGNCIVVAVKTGYTIAFFGFIETGSESYYLLFNANIYTK